jgi:hypothetical protein
VITTINTGKLFYCGVFHPDDDKQNVLMSGCGDKKIYQFDLNTGDVEQVGLSRQRQLASMCCGVSVHRGALQQHLGGAWSETECCRRWSCTAHCTAGGVAGLQDSAVGGITEPSAGSRWVRS